MPLHEYECDACGHRFERIQKFSDPPIDVCPKCGGPVHKLISSPAFQFKGTGFYITDYPKKDASAGKGSGESKEGGGKEGGGKEGSGKEGGGKEGGGKDSGKDSGGQSSDSKSSESKGDGKSGGKSESSSSSSSSDTSRTPAKPKA